MDTAPWEGDKLNRQADGEHLIDLLLERYEFLRSKDRGSYILNIDASWGVGKTFFLNCLRNDLQGRGHLVAYVNAWQDDHSNDPLVTVMAAIESELKPFFPKSDAVRNAFTKGKKAMGIVAAESSKQAGFHALRAITGISVKSIIEALQNDADAIYKFDQDAFDKSAETVWEKSLENLVGERLAEHEKMSVAIETFRQQTAKAIAKLPSDKAIAPFFVFIDELDRCRPLYAIKMLEELKHLFAIVGVVFVVATDSEQLSHSVRAIYGSEFESRRYLRRFFDRVFVFPETDRNAYISSLFENHGINPQEVFSSPYGIKPVYIFGGWAEAFELSNRDLEQCFEIISTFVTSWSHKAKIEPIFLLALIYLFYVKSDPKFSEIYKSNADDMDLKKWSISYSYYDSQFHRHNETTHTAAALIKNLITMLDKPIHSVEYSELLYAKEFIAECQQRFNGQVPTGTTSVLNEYPSRVRNAGRFIDPKDVAN